MVDTEPKAVKPLLNLPTIPASAAVIAKDAGGRGSNWAYGYGANVE